jgi:argininosuccinate lyase
MCADASRSLRLFAGLMSHAEVDREKMGQRASGSFLTVTELADTLVREEEISFRTAHQLVAAAVRSVGREYSPDRLVTELESLAPKSLGRPLRKPREVWLRALDPAHFINVRETAGGPAPEAVKAQIATAREEQVVTMKWLDTKRLLLEQYPRLIHHASAVPDHLG